MENQDRKALVDQEAAENAHNPSIMEKLAVAKAEYAEDGDRPNPEMYEHITDLMAKLVVMRKAEARAQTLRRSKRKSQKQARKKNRKR